MPRLLRPTAARLRTLAAAAAGRPLQAATECLEGPCPPRWHRNALRVRVGHGDRDFAAARAAVLALLVFEQPGVVAAADGPLRPGSHVAVAGAVLGGWWTNVCRVTDVYDDAGRGGFAYATVQGHMLAGAERFAVERDADGGVWFDLLACARPVHPLARLGLPLLRRLQRRFARQAGAALAAAIARPCRCQG